MVPSTSLQTEYVSVSFIEGDSKQGVVPQRGRERDSLLEALVQGLRQYRFQLILIHLSA